MKKINPTAALQKQLASKERQRYGTSQRETEYRCTKADIAVFWLAVGELIEFRGAFSAEVPGEGWTRRLGLLSKSELLQAFEWFVHEKPMYPPTIMDFLRWAKKPASPKSAETIQQYVERIERENKNKLEVKYAQKKIKEKYWNEIKLIVNNKSEGL